MYMCNQITLLYKTETNIVSNYNSAKRRGRGGGDGRGGGEETAGAEWAKVSKSQILGLGRESRA